MKNTIIRNVDVVDYTHDGKGIVKIDGFPLFVKDVLIDENVDIKVLKTNKNYGFAKLEKINKKSINRIKPECSFYYQCGGCQLQIMDYSQQVLFKKNKVLNAFNKQKISLVNYDFIENEKPLFYRNKISIPLKKGETIQAGLYKENSNDIVVIDKCIIQEEMINDVLDKIVYYLNQFNISIYDKATNKGLLRQIVLRSFTSTKEVLVGLVINKNNYSNELYEVIEKLKNIDIIKTIIINLNARTDNVILSNNNYIVYNDGYVMDKSSDYMFRISLNSFYQVNSIQMKKLYYKAIELANLNGTENVFDAYCGVGTISIYLSKYVKSVVGVDIVESAIKDANENKKLNNIKNIDFICNDVASYMKKKKEFDCVFLDPPRKGCSKEFLEDLIKMNPKKIVYIACDVATQARDVRILIDSGYEIKSSCSVDMFSQTHHIENIVYLEKDI